MPVTRGRDDEGPFYRWGERGKRYRYTPGDDAGRRRARSRAAAQGRAAKARESTAAMDDATWTPGEAAQRNGGMALEVRDSKPPSQRGMTPVGLARARDLKNGRPLSIRTTKRALRYLARHLKDKQGATWADEGKGWQAWHGWGGDDIVLGALRAVRKVDPSWADRFEKTATGAALLRHVRA